MPTTSEDLVKTAMCEVWLEPFRIHSSGVQVIRCTHVGIASNRSIDTKYVAVSTFVFLTFDTTRHDTPAAAVTVPKKPSAIVQTQQSELFHGRGFKHKSTACIEDLPLQPSCYYVTHFDLKAETIHIFRFWM